MANKLRASGQIQDKDRYIPISEAKKQLVAMLAEIQLEIEESENCGKAFHLGLQMASNIIQQKISKLRGNKDVEI